MRIGIDIDSTLNTLDLEWSRWIIQNHDPTFTLDKWTDWDIHKLTPAGLKVFDYLNIPGTFRNSGVREGAKDAVAALQKAGHELFVVSSCDPAGSWAEKYDWVEEHFPSIRRKNRIACSRKGLLKLHLLIDDGPHNREEFDGHFIVFDQPWNQQYPGDRVYSWKQLSFI